MRTWNKAMVAPFSRAAYSSQGPIIQPRLVGQASTSLGCTSPTDQASTAQRMGVVCVQGMALGLPACPTSFPSGCMHTTSTCAVQYKCMSNTETGLVRLMHVRWQAVSFSGRGMRSAAWRACCARGEEDVADLLRVCHMDSNRLCAVTGSNKIWPCQITRPQLHLHNSDWLIVSRISTFAHQIP